MYQDITGGEGPSNALVPSVIGTAGITTTTLAPNIFYARYSRSGNLGSLCLRSLRSNPGYQLSTKR